MDDNKKDISGGLKKILLAGVGAASITKEKTSEFLGDLVKKGEDVVGQNDSIKEKLDEAEEIAKSAGEKAKSTLKETAERFAAVKDLDFSEILDRLTPEQFKALKDQILKKGEAPADGEGEEEELCCEVSEELKAKGGDCCSEEKAEEECCCSEEKAEDECCCSEEKAEDESCCSEDKAEGECCCSEEKAEDEAAPKAEA